MKLKAVSGITLTLLLIGVLILTFNIQPVKAEPMTIIVPDDYSTIQEAINNANEGDTIYVKAAIYYENIVVNKNNLTLFGEDKDTTIIDGSGTGKVVAVRADYVTISGFTVQNSGPYDPIWVYRGTGISLYSSSGSVLVDNIVINNCEGIEINRSDETTISYDTILNNSVGIEIWLSSFCTINDNTICFNGYGISIEYYSGGNTISGNNITSNIGYGILLGRAGSGNIISGNKISLNGAIGIGLVNTNGTTICRNAISNSEEGFHFPSMSNNNNITCNTVSNNKRGVYLGWESYGNMFYHNNFINNTNRVYSSGSNSWDDGYPSGGNYWSDHVCTGNPSDGSQPYTIDENNIDHYPFQDPNGWLLPPPIQACIYTDKDTYTASDIMHVGLDVYNPLGQPITVYVRIWLEMPCGYVWQVVYSLPRTLPAGFTYSNPNFKSFVLPIMPNGAYTWHAALLDPSTHETIVEDTAQWQFQ